MRFFPRHRKCGNKAACGTSRRLHLRLCRERGGDLLLDEGSEMELLLLLLLGVQQLLLLHLLQQLQLLCRVRAGSRDVGSHDERAAHGARRTVGWRTGEGERSGCASASTVSGPETK